MGTVLIVDDEFGIADLIDAILTDEGHMVLTAANGRQGLAMLAEQKLDLVFLDYMMPVMDGAVMLSHMSNDASLRSIPVVLMSSMPEATVAKRCSGYVVFLPKPFRIAQITDLAEQLMKGSPGLG